MLDLNSASSDFDTSPELCVAQLYTFENFPLKATSPKAWIATVLADFNTFLLDHASCERKAASVCLSFLSRHSDYPVLTEPLITLAREELDHFGQVYRLIQKRGLTLSYDEPDHYVKNLFAQMRHGAEDRLLDRLVISGIIEARGFERFSLIAEALTEPELKEFYTQLARSEGGHYRVFLRIAEKIFSEEKVAHALNRLVTIEAQVLQDLPLRAAVH